MDETPEFEGTFTAPMWVWSGEGPASWYFLTLPLDVAEAIKAARFGARGHFGMVHVRAAIDDVIWETKLFPDKSSGSFHLPVKAIVRKKAGIKMGDHVTVDLTYTGLSVEST